MSLATHPALSAAVCDIVAPETAWGHVIRTRAAIPAFVSRISPWHQDVVSPDDKTGCARVRLACWIPLANVDETTGALELIPAACQTPFPHVMRDDGHFGIPDDALPAGERRVMPMSAGDVLLLDRFVPHRARPPEGSRGRWAVVMWVKTGGASAC
jgi:ectoine hydroxylase-related dioxygenase (phytanoyl-CoA dioxygenase family)